MKIKAYMRVAQDKDAGNARGRRPKVDAQMWWTAAPLTNSRNQALPTVAFAVEFELPDGLFERATQVIAEIKVPDEQAEIAASVTPRER